MNQRPIPPEVDRGAATQAAVAARRARAKIKAELAAAIRTPIAVAQEAWRDPASAEAGLRVTDFLSSMRGLGPTKVPRVLAELNISDRKRLGRLGKRQRERLTDYLASTAAGTATGTAPRLVVLAGPTAVGKGTVARHIRENYPDVVLSISATTRRPRPGEVNGVDYYFVSETEFDSMIEHEQLLEWATVHTTHRYGTPRAPIDAALDGGRPVLLEIDLQGARLVRRAMPEALLVFLLPPSWDELVRRLIGRGTENQEEQQIRLESAKGELAAQDEFDAKVINAEVSQAAREVVDLMNVSGGS
jgi:guanylate kinase